MKTPILSLTLIAVLSTSAFATNQYVLMGGGGEPVGAKDIYGNPIMGTIFDSSLANTSHFVNQSPNWKKEVSFNGGHPKTENILRTDFGGVSTSDFTAQEYQRIISKYESQLQNGELRKGDQLLIHIDSHGAIKIKGQETHSIASARGGLSNLETLGNATTVNLDELKRITTLAKEKGVKVGIIDGSCHSGNTQTLADENTCVISGSGPNHFSFAGKNTFSGKFTELMEPGKSLEDIYLEARKKSSDSGFPMISSPAGKMAQEQLYPLLTPYLYYFAPPRMGDKLSDHLLSGDNLSCRDESNFQELNQIINTMEEITTVTKTYFFFFKFKKKTINFNPLREALAEYHDFQKEISDRVASFDIGDLNKVETIQVKEDFFNYSVNFTHRELLDTDYTQRINDAMARLNTATTASEKSNLRLNIALYKEAQIKSRELALKYPGYRNYKSTVAQIANKEEKSRQMAYKIGIEARKLYDAIYKDHQKAGTSEANPCRDFVL